MVFRRDSNKIDSFQRQMSSLRQQIGSDEPEGEEFDTEPRDAHSQSSERGRNQRLSGDEGYSFGSFPPSGLRTEQLDPLDDGEMPAIPEMPQADQQVSVIATGTTWKGDLESQASIHVYGKVSGSLKAAEDIWIAEGAEVDATIDGDRVIAAGEIAGTITAHSRFEALPECELHADVNAPTFVVHEGATINGALSMTGRDARPGGLEDRESRARSNSIIQRRQRSSS
ncbi:MAG: bactofilin family protein [Thermomicrobiales bacterium]